MLAQDEAHKKVFDEVPMIGFRNNKSLKVHLVRAVLPRINEVGSSKSCGGKRSPCHLCKNFKSTSTFNKSNSNEIYDISGTFNCSSKNVVYLIECKVCSKQYVGSTITKFRYRANNYKSIFRKFEKGEKVSKQALNQTNFHEHFLAEQHSGIEDWVITIIDEASDESLLRKKELFSIHKLNTFLPIGLNEREVYSAY